MADALDNLTQLEFCLKLVLAKQGGFSQTLSKIRMLGVLMSAEMDRLATEVEETKTVIDSAITLLSGLADQIRDAAGDRAKSVALANELDAKANALGTAVAANTPTPPPA